MKKITLTFLSLFIFSLLFTSCESDDNAVFTEEQSISDIALTYTAMEQDIINLVNDYRITNGLPELNLLNIVSAEAIDHTNYMVQVGELNHDNFAVRHQNLVARANAKSVAENVAYGYLSADGVVNAWVNSDGHKRNIENSEFTHMGISMKKDENGRPYFTNIFIKR